MEIIYFLLAILIGTTSPIQSGINSQLSSHWANSSIFAAAVSFAIGTIALFIIIIIARIPIPSFSNTGTEWWHWLGGFLGAYFVTAMAFLAPKLGAMTLMTLVLAGQIGISIVLDHFGILGYAQKSISLPQIFGLLLVITGIIIIRKF